MSWAPDGSASSPSVRFSARLRIYPGRAGPSIVTMLSTTLVSSTMTMASAPIGMGAPVMIRLACPFPTTGRFAEPAWEVPTISSFVPEFTQSSARTANPSIAELSKRGSSTFEARPEERTRPLASSKLTDSVRRGSGTSQANSMARSNETPRSTNRQTPPR